MKHPEPLPLSAADICWLLRAKFQRPEFAIVFQVGDSTGINTKRHADVIVMNCFPSRGLSLHGIEIKISREDLKREIRDPEKAEPIAAYCDTWSIAVPKALNLTGLEVPTNWGIYEAEPDKIALLRNPMRLEPKPINRAFLASLLRADGIERDYISNRLVTGKIAELEANFEKRVEAAIANKVARDDERSRWVKIWLSDLEKAGIGWNQLRWNEKGFVEAIKYAMSPKKYNPKLIESAIVSLEKCAKELRICTEAMSVLQQAEGSGQ